MPDFADDVALLTGLTGEVFDDWLSTQSRGSFLSAVEAATAHDGAVAHAPSRRDRGQRTQVTRSCAPSGRAAST